MGDYIRKFFMFAVLLAISVLAAGLYGAVHNQISYTVAPEYFHVLKFPQFIIPFELHNRTGATIVGLRASWWMGLLVGVPILLRALRIPDPSLYFQTGVRAILLVLTMAAFFGLAGFGLLTLVGTPEIAANFTLPRGVTDPVAFLTAGAMHEGSYIGGLLGILAGLVYTSRVYKRAISEEW